MPATPAVRFYLWHAGLALAAAAVVLFVFEFTELDRRLSDLVYDPVNHEFPFRHVWLLEVMLHEWAKYLLVLVGLGACVGFGASFFLETIRVHRRALLFVFLSMALSAIFVSSLRHVTDQHCPYDLIDYGGYAPYRHLLDPVAPGVKAGECSPSRHAAGGFGLLAFYFVQRQRRARWVLATGIGYGLVLGIGRFLQGAVFLSYVLWAGIAVWCVTVVLYGLILQREHLTKQTGASAPAPR